MPAYVCIGAPYWLGESRPERTEVDAVKNSGIAAEIGAEWVEIEPDFSAVDNPVAAINRAIADVITAHFGKVPLVFSSDCTNCLGMMKGLEPYQPDVLWYDAHGDFNTPETSPSGFLGGMPLAAMVGRGNEGLMRAVGLQPVAENKVTITDARDLDPEEGVNLAKSQLTHIKDVSHLLNRSWEGRPLYIHFDTDVIDIDELPAMNYPAPGGPSLDVAAGTLQYVNQSANVVGVLFSLWNDTLPGADKALSGTLKLVRALTE